MMMKSSVKDAYNKNFGYYFKIHVQAMNLLLLGMSPKILWMPVQFHGCDKPYTYITLWDVEWLTIK